MSLFDFFKKTDKVGRDSAIDSNELVEGSEQTESKDKVSTKLSFHPDWNVPQEQQYVFRFLANELKPLNPNQLSLAAISIDEEPRSGDWLVKAFFRSSIPNSIELGEIELILLDKDDQLIASKPFNFNELGTIPPESARPWVFTFEKSLIDGKDIPDEGWKIAFNLISLRDHMLDLDETWKNQLPKEQQEILAKVIKDLPKLSKNEVNFTGFQVKLHDNQSLHVSIFIRNGHNKVINLEQLPLEIIDANGKLIAKGSFKLDPILSVQPNSTKPWTFIFPAELVTAEDADLSRWAARVPQ
ncbi:accessory Sec system S-layer assembly protein [Lysinibacillus composti]|uniref:Accessory Sec system S-layer assembly protein n=1 Tax=Lysinibacillus composti TaxID=720633 RepID=A0A3N9UH45_9BACI|nr:accessory Sec system S-layer assembly protein [Lysinibacillus composti]MBM7607989.1 accessory Sec system S-layer assembly protein [Lysinibacillus composti]RQW75449.1 accessory Sec system S-layer assembly protein [Lysinibacillus composti]